MLCSYLDCNLGRGKVSVQAHSRAYSLSSTRLLLYALVDELHKF